MIARSLSASVSTVSKYLSRAQAKQLQYEAIQHMDDKTLIETLCGKKQYRHAERPLLEGAYIHQELKKKGVTLRLLWEEYKESYPDGYQISQFCEYYRRWRGTQRLSMRQTHKAGEKMFVDYAGQTVPIYDRHTGTTTPAHIFIAVLGASNYTFVEAHPDQTLPHWIQGHVHSYEYFDGVPKVTVPDNLKSGVSRSCMYEPELNRTYQDMASHYGTVLLPARRGKPRDKAKVEAAVLVVERWILARLRNRTFFSVGELNGAIRELREEVNAKPFKKIDGSRSSWFTDIEKKELQTLPEEPYEYRQWKYATVNVDYHIDVHGHYYSVPSELRGKRVDVALTTTTVEIFYNNERVASHRRDNRKGWHSTIKEHMPPSHRAYAEWSPERFIRWGQMIGSSTAELMKTIMDSREYPLQGYRSCMGILRLKDVYSQDRLEAACARALTFRGYSYRSVVSILKNGLDQHREEYTGKNVTIVHANVRGKRYFSIPHTHKEVS